MSKTLTLTLDNSQSSIALRIYVDTVKASLPQNITVEYNTANDNGVQLATTLNDSPISLFGASTIAQYIDRAIIANNGSSSIVSRPTALENCQLLQWISFCQRELTNNTTQYAEYLDVLNKSVLNNTFFVGTTLSLADIFLFAHLYNHVKTNKSVAKYQALLRWFDFMQNTLPLTGVNLDKIPQLPFNNKPFAFKPLVPPPATTASTQAAATGEQGKPQQQQQQGKKEAAAKKDEKKAAPAASTGGKQQAAADISPSILDMRIGKVLSVKKHESADKLYVEEIDVGEDAPRTICSGLVGKIPMEEIQGKDVLVMCNLKPSNMVGVASNGMVVCSTNKETGEVELVKIPENSYKIGERIVVEGHDGAPGVPNQVSKKLSKILPLFSTNDKGEVVFNSTHRFTTKSGAVLYSKFTGAEVK